MAAKTVNFNTNCDLCESYVAIIAKWLSCNGEVWGVGPTLVFASAAALFLYNELKSAVIITGDHAHIYMLEKTLVSTMVVGMLALMVQLWVCSMRFFQYYLDQIIRESPSMLLELTTAGLLGGKAEVAALGPLTRFLRTQQPQIHMTVCWFLSLCYADYIRKNYCSSFNLPYLEQWQTELHQRAVRSVNVTVQKVSSFVGKLHHRLRGFTPEVATQPCPACARTRPAYTTVRACPLRKRRSRSVPPVAKSSVAVGVQAARWTYPPHGLSVNRTRNSTCGSLAQRARLLPKPLRNSEMNLKLRNVPVKVHPSPASIVLCVRKTSFEDCPFRNICRLPFDSLLQ